MPPITRSLIIACVAVFGLEFLLGNAVVINFALWPFGMSAGPLPGFMPWQVVTYSFLHGNLTHLLFNMFALYMFGGELERFLGQRRYLNLYFTSVVTAALVQLALPFVLATHPAPVLGASGGVFGLLLAYAIYFPRRTVVLLIPPIPLPARVFVFLYGALELYLGVTGTQEGVAHFAHLGGMLGAWLLIRHWRGPRRYG
ncbi:MAG: rhomboid family intramembrane serine protease [Betaproteobacteria bacterium]|nr:rhomboid family intramembrane serine protease [Betaproteobacteria bacterium]